ncbi:hypothetical protein LCGC14_1857660 [marine sediment metagenome]|uniref:Uncharacterized protein n=1 Tax=marine sediment metagenome TaxID=412755 RepID=A0A0F9J7J6_9ZZZZ
MTTSAGEDQLTLVTQRLHVLSRPRRVGPDSRCHPLTGCPARRNLEVRTWKTIHKH